MSQTLELEEDGGAREVSATPSKSIGTTVAGTYRITRHIGSGGSSHVFEAEHVRLGKPFAVKLLRPELDPTRQTAQRFRREARAIARLSNEYIVSVVDCGELPDHTPYLVMELLAGSDLRALLKREQSLPARRAVPLMLEACHALAEAHSAGLVHRDLKPENLFITRRATGEDWCKVLDFGVAKMDASMSTTQGTIVGTVRYMAPEQLADSGRVGPTTDIYALGAILYECLSGHAAHAGDTIQEAMFSVLNKDPTPLSEVPPALGSLVQCCLAKDPLRRPQSARALAELLSATLAPAPAPVAAERTSNEDDELPAVPPGSRSAARRWARLLAPIGIGMVGSASALGWWWSERTNQPSTTPAATPAAPREPQVAVPAPIPLTPARPEPQPAVIAATGGPAVSAGKPRSSVPRVTAHPGVPATQTATPPGPPRVPTVGNLDPANPYSE